MTTSRKLHLFEAIGLEIESMIVDAHTMDIRPIADQLFHRVLGQPGSDVDGEIISWSNELVAHVVEFKTTNPAPTIEAVLAPFHAETLRAARELERLGCRLLPGAMHPWMDPRRETVLWPHENNEIYRTFDRIFGCQGHGWSNLQSLHINLPFANDNEFKRLHTAIRLVLPLIPALAAGSPFEEGKATGFLDTRMKHYAQNSAKIPRIAGQIVPEPITSEDEYHAKIFTPMFEAIAPHDPEEIMRDEWLNARGAIARFGRGSIEIRVIDAQESCRANLAIAAAVVAVVRALVYEKWSPVDKQLGVAQADLVHLFQSAIRVGPEAIITHRPFLSSFGFDGNEISAGQLWRQLVTSLLGAPEGIDPCWTEDLELMVWHGPLATRLLRATGNQPDRAALHELHLRLARVLERDELFSTLPY